jgi:hypothetical protein
MRPKDTAIPKDARQVKKAIRSYLDGMGEYTAKVIILDHVGEELKDTFDLQPIENLGRYYHAKVVGPGGEIIDDLLVDKQSGNVISSRRTSR